MNEKTKQRIEDHGQVLRLCDMVEKYRRIALTINCKAAAEEADQLLSDISRNHLLDRLLKGGE